MIKTGESDCEWEGYNKTEDNVYKEGDVHRADMGAMRLNIRLAQMM